MRNSLLVIFASFLVVCFSIVTLADNTPPSPPTGELAVPPREAFSACDGKQAGDKVTFTTPRGETLTGYCKLLPARLAAIVDRPPRPQENTQNN